MKETSKRILDFLSGIPSWGLIIPILVIILVSNLYLSMQKHDENIDDSHSFPYTEYEQKVFDIINGIPDNSKVLVIVNFGPESKYELEAALSSLIGFFAKKNVGIAFVTMIPNGVETAFMAVEKSIESGNLGKERFVYGHEYTHLGYIAGGNIASYLIANNFDQVREHDIFNSSIDIQPIMAGVGDISDFSAVFEFSSQTFDGVPGIVSFSLFSKASNIKKVAFCSSDMLSAYIPFYGTRYIDGLIGGFKSVSLFIKEVQPSSKIGYQYDMLSIILIYIVLVLLFSNIINILKDRR